MSEKKLVEFKPREFWINLSPLCVFITPPTEIQKQICGPFIHVIEKPDSIPIPTRGLK